VHLPHVPTDSPAPGTFSAGSPRESIARVRVRYAETDQMGVVYYANYFVWFEVARCELLRTLGWTYREMEGEGIALPVIDARCEYLQPTHYDDELEIVTRGTLLSPARVEFRYDVVRPDRVTAARGRTLHASINARGRPCRLPERIRTAFA
jgi:acyl-CoA thioester hydrolase